MIQNIIFDLDGVLFDGASFHKQSFMNSVKDVAGNIISSDFHDTVLNGLSTKQKLDVLKNRELINIKQSTEIEKLKIKNTAENLSEFVKKCKNTYVMILKLYKDYNLYCVTNSIRESCNTVLHKLEIYDFFAGIISNEDVTNPKPNPEPYLHVIEKYSLNPYETIIIEDSKHGRTAAYKSNAHVIPVVDPTDVTYEKIIYELKKLQIPKHIMKEQKVNIVVPMAGHGSRFSKVGYTVPKPFIPVFNKPMIQWVIENITPGNEIYDNIEIDCTIKPYFHFIAQAEHLKQYDLGKICKGLGIDYTITTVDKVTEGPACTVLLTKEYINNDTPLVTINSDQFLDWDVNNFYRCLLNPSFDGCINTFYQPNEKDIKWSYAKIDDKGLVTEVAEKKYISNLATTGIYGWKRGSDFVKYAEKMIAENERVNNEFYVCPVYNGLIKDGGKVRTFNCKKLWGLGVPEDLENFLQLYPGK
jgi:HAD superfamily hydrolase (TIGR01509 family)